MRKIKFDDYEVALRTYPQATSNYNTTAALYRITDKGEKELLFGTAFKETATDKEVLMWAFEMIDKPEDNLFPL